MVTRSSRRNTPAKKTPAKKGGRASTAKKSASSKKGPSYRDLQAQCLAAGLSGAGTAAALADRLAAAKAAFDDGEYDSQADNDDTTDNSGSDDDDDSEVDDDENRMLAGAMLDTDESDNSYSDDEEDDMEDYEEEEEDSEDEAEMAAVVSDLLNSLDGDSDDEGDYVAVRSGAYDDDEDDEEGGYDALELVDDDDDEEDDEEDDEYDDDDDEAQCEEEMDMMNGNMLIDLGDDAAGSEVDAQYDAKLGFYSSARMARSFVNILMTVEALCFFVLLFVAVDAAAQHDTAATGMEALLRALVAGGASLAMWQQTVVYVTVFHVAPTVAGLAFGRYWHPQSVLLQSLARYAAYSLLFDAGWLFTDLFALHFPLRVFELTVRVGVALALWEAVQPRATNVYHLGTFI